MKIPGDSEIKELIKSFLAVILAAGMYATMAHADDSRDMRITQEAMRDAKAFQIEASHANRYHKAYKVTVAIAEDFLNQASYQEIIAGSYPAFADQENYRKAFISWIAWETVGKFSK